MHFCHFNKDPVSKLVPHDSSLFSAGCQTIITTRKERETIAFDRLQKRGPTSERIKW